MKHQFTITIDTPDPDLADRIRDEAVGGIEDFIESKRPDFNIDCGELVEVKDPDPTDEFYRDLANETRYKDGDIEFDDGAKVSLGDDTGAYVQGWVWIAGAPPAEDEEEEQVA